VKKLVGVYGDLTYNGFAIGRS